MANSMSDTELDTLLATVRQPQLPNNFAETLQRRIEQDLPDNVVRFPIRQQAPEPRRRVWLSAIPLAASLVLGIYLGAQGFDLSSVDDMAAASLGIEDTESFLNGDLT